MKNREIAELVDGGFSAITTYSLNATDAYRVYKLKKAILEAAMNINTSEQNFLDESGIKDTMAFNQRLLELKRQGDSEERQEAEAKLKRYNEMRLAMMEDEADIAGDKLIRYESWRKLQEENKNKKFNGRDVDILSGRAEMLLEGVLWAPPEEE